jgi:phage portal protein BeeE
MTPEARSRIGLDLASHRNSAAELRGGWSGMTPEARSRLGLDLASHRNSAAELRGGEQP